MNLWGYARLAIGPGKGGYYHPRFFFRENVYEICKMQRRRIIKGGASTASSPKSTAFSTKETVSAANTSGSQQQQVITAAKKQKKLKRQPSLSAVSVVSQGSSDCELSPIKPPKTLTTTTMMMMPTPLPDSSKSNCTAATTSIAAAISLDNNKSLQSMLDLDLDFDGLEFSSPSQVQQQQQQQESATTTTTTTTTYTNPPQGGDCIDFEGRSYFFLDEKEIATAYNTARDVELLRNPPTPTVPRRVSRQNHEQEELYRPHQLQPKIKYAAAATAAAVPIGMVPSLPNLTTANMLSEISRRRVSVEIDKFAAASRRVYDHAACASASTSTSASVSTTEQQDDDDDEWWQ